LFAAAIADALVAGELTVTSPATLAATEPTMISRTTTRVLSSRTTARSLSSQTTIRTVDRN